MIKVFLIAAQSLDGYIAEKADQTSTDWTSKEDKQFFRERTKQAGVVIFGSKTYETIGKPLPGRVNIVYTRAFQRSNVKKLQQGEVGYTDLEPRELISELEKAGFTEVAICGGASIYSLFMNAGVVDTLYITVEPVIFGKGVKLFSDHVKKQSLQLEKAEKLGERAVLLEYTVVRF